MKFLPDVLPDEIFKGDPGAGEASQFVRTTMSLSPFVYWAQTETHIYLRADLNNIKDHEVVAEMGKLY